MQTKETVGRSDTCKLTVLMCVRLCIVFRRGLVDEHPVIVGKALGRVHQRRENKEFVKSRGCGGMMSIDVRWRCMEYVSQNILKNAKWDETDFLCQYFSFYRNIDVFPVLWNYVCPALLFSSCHLSFKELKVPNIDYMAHSHGLGQWYTPTNVILQKQLPIECINVQRRHRGEESLFKDENDIRIKLKRWEVKYNDMFCYVRRKMESTEQLKSAQAKKEINKS